jgi:signal transduction histidine kinase
VGETELRRTFTTSVVRWALATRVVSLLLLVVFATGRLAQPNVQLALALLCGWSLVWLAPRGRTLHVVQRHPIIAVGDVLMALVVTAMVGVASPLVFATLSTALVIGVLFRPALAVILTIILVCGYVLVALAQANGSDYFVFTFVIPATYAVLALLGNVTRHLHEKLLDEQARLAETFAEAAAAAERARLARDMHDSVAKSLHGVALAAAALPRWIDQDQEAAVRQATAIQHAAEQASMEARDLLVSLRTLSEGPLVERLTDLVAEFRGRSGLETRFEAHNLADLDAEVSHEVLLVVAEALENVQRHADASTVEVSLDSLGGDADEVRLRVADDGRGFDPRQIPAKHFGVVGMRERAAAIGGRLEVDSAPGSGTTVTLVIPSLTRKEVSA